MAASAMRSGSAVLMEKRMWKQKRQGTVLPAEGGGGVGALLVAAAVVAEGEGGGEGGEEEERGC